MKVLFIGGTGNISTAVSRLSVECGIDLYLLNRGKRKVKIPGTKVIKGDVSDPSGLLSVLGRHRWDAVVDWIAFTQDQVEREYRVVPRQNKTICLHQFGICVSKTPILSHYHRIDSTV